jgi:flavin reductase (DIM6/NTAB) family NADH-FMN oxidoreductase RutF
LALGQWPSGVTVVTSQVGAVPAGMTVSAFFSVSLTPPLIAVCLDGQAATLKVILASRQFAVNVLSTSQHNLSERFAKEDEPVRFDGIPLYAAEGAQSPLLAGSVVSLDCELEATHEAGDHVLCIGQIRLVVSHPGEPLLFHASRYHRLAALEGDGQ